MINKERWLEIIDMIHDDLIDRTDRCDSEGTITEKEFVLIVARLEGLIDDTSTN